MEAAFQEVIRRIEAPFDDLIKKHGVQPWTKYICVVEVDNKLLGGWPKDPKMELAMLEARYRDGLIREETYLAAKQRAAAQSSSDPKEETDKAIEKAATGFKSNDTGIYIESRQIKAGFKEVCSALRFTSNKQTKQEIQHGFFICGIGENPDLIYFDQDGKVLKSPNGYEQLIAHVETARGPRSTIKFHDYVLGGTKFAFEIWFVQPKESQVTEKLLVTCLEVIQRNGFGCSRSQGFGRVKVLHLDKICDGKIMHVLNKKERDKLSKELDKIAKEEAKKVKEAKAKAKEKTGK